MEANLLASALPIHSRGYSLSQDFYHDRSHHRAQVTATALTQIINLKHQNTSNVQHASYMLMVNATENAVQACNIYLFEGLELTSSFLRLEDMVTSVSSASRSLSFSNGNVGKASGMSFSAGVFGVASATAAAGVSI